MKLDALDHPKTLDLAARLNVELPTAIGYLELLWAFTGKKAPQGNIGKWPDGAIARACFWMGPPETFLGALLAARFLDSDPTHRYLIHDWPEHAPRWVKSKLKSLGLAFVQDVSGDTAGDDDDDDGTYIGEDVSADSKGSPLKGSEGLFPQRDAKATARKKAASTKTPIPEDFSLTPDRQSYAEKHLPQVDSIALMDHFRSTSKAKGWKYVDWDQCWQTLVRQWGPNSGHWSSGQYPRKPVSASDKPRDPSDPDDLIRGRRWQ